MPHHKKKQNSESIDEGRQLGEKHSCDEASHTTLTANSSGSAELHELEEILNRRRMELAEVQMELAAQRRVTARLEQMGLLAAKEDGDSDNSNTEEAVVVRIVADVLCCAVNPFCLDIMFLQMLYWYESRMNQA